MPNYTENYNLEKPLPNENYNVEVFNNNADIIDQKIKYIENSVENIEVPVTSVNNKTGNVELTAEDIGAETPEGSQAKADTAEENAKAYADTTKANKSHTHTKSQITDFPTSLPANGGNASTANKLSNARIISLAGDVTGSVSFDGSKNVSINTSVANNSHTHTKANITDFPSSMPANGGNADTVDGCHADTDYNGTAYQLARYNSSGKVYNSDRVDGYHFRVSNGVLQYSSNGTTWKNAGEGVSMVKSVQRGSRIVKSSIDISISSVNLSKSIVILTTSIAAAKSGEYYDGTTYYISAELTSSSNLQISASTDRSVPVKWQVIEYV